MYTFTVEKMKKRILAIVFIYLQCINAQSYTKNNVGNLQYTQQYWEFQQILNITDYRYTTELLEKCIETLKMGCYDSQNDLCQYFLKVVNNINLNTKTDIEKLNTLVREKREITLLTVALIALGTSIVTAAVSYFMYKSALEDVKNEMKEHLDLFEKAAKASQNAAEIQKLIGKDVDKALCIIRETYNNNTKNFDEHALFSYVMDTVILATINHQNFQSKLNHLYDGDIDERLFEFIDYKNFTGEIMETNRKLEPHLFIPTLKPLGKNNFAKISTKFNKTHLILGIKLPILNKKLFELNEFIPIPIREENSLFILSIKPVTYYRDGNILFNLPTVSKHQLCATQENLTICNTLVEESIVPTSKCIQNLLLLNSDDNCLYKPIQFKNYFIHISDNKIFAFIVKPIEIVKQCENLDDEVLFLTKSQEIWLQSECTLYKYHNEDQSILPKHTDSTFFIPDMGLEIGNPPRHIPISKLPILSKYDILQTSVINSLQNVQNAIPLAKERIDKIKIENPISALFGDWNLKDWLIYGLLWILGIIFIILICFIIIKKLINKIL